MFHGDTNSGLEQATQPALNNTEDPQQTQENIPTEVATILDSAVPQSMTVVQNSSGRCFLVWLTMTTNHCQRTFQQKKNRMHPVSHSSSWPGSIQAVAFDRIPSPNPGAEPPRDARDSGSARSHSMT